MVTKHRKKSPPGKRFFPFLGEDEVNRYMALEDTEGEDEQLQNIEVDVTNDKTHATEPKTPSKNTKSNKKHTSERNKKKKRKAKRDKAKKREN